MSSHPTKPTKPLTPTEQEHFTSLHLQRATQEFAEDLDKLRGLDDFKNDALPQLIGALKQGTALYSDEEKRRVLSDARKAEEKGDRMDVDGDEEG